MRGWLTARDGSDTLGSGPTDIQLEVSKFLLVTYDVALDGTLLVVQLFS